MYLGFIRQVQFNHWYWGQERIIIIGDCKGKWREWDISLFFLRYIPSFRTFEFIPDSHKCFVRVCVSDECKCIVGSVTISDTLQIKHSSIWISNHLSPVISWHIINFEHFVDRECPSCYPLLNCRCIWV